ncbi:MAG: hypothetical protein OXL41_04725 [Nitrospinae bacterium]|nr:hypothetical protein [Nitrospinota bacterium]
MAVWLRAALAQWGTLRVALAALAGAVACIAGLAWCQDRLGGFALRDSRGWYTPAEAAALFETLDRLDAGARTVYAATGLTIDMFFPLAYGLLFAILLFRLFRAPLWMLPLALAAADALENAAVAALALSYAGAPSPFAWLAAAFTPVKTALIAAVLAAVGIGTVHWLWRRRGR